MQPTLSSLAGSLFADPMDVPSVLVRRALWKRHGQCGRHANEVGDRFGLHFAHQPTATNLQRSLADAESLGSLLIEEATDHQRQNLSFAGGEARIALPQSCSLCSLRPRAAILSDGCVNCRQ